MDIAIAREIKKHEYRVSATPDCVAAFVKAGHTVRVEAGAGEGTGYEDGEYEAVGAEIVDDRKRLFAEAEMIVKVKEPLAEEIPLLQEGQILFTYLHLASDAEMTRKLMERKIVGVAYETIQLDDGALPLLRPMSEIAGRLSIQEGAKYLEKAFGGRGILLGGVPGVRRGKVTILGGGIVGINAAKIAVGIGADVTVLDVAQRRLAYLDDIFGSSLQTLYSNESNILSSIADADLVIGAVLLPGASAPRLIRREHLATMRKGAVIVDVAVDQGGCVETTHPTSHDAPIYTVDDVVHYCVANMPGVVALTATLALTNQTLPYGLKIANRGVEAAVAESEPLRRGVNLYKGALTYEAVAESLGLEYTPLGEAM